MREVDFTWARALRLWWGFAWRWTTALIIIAFGAALVSVISARTGGQTDLIRSPLVTKVTLLLWVIASPWAIRASLLSGNRNYRVALIVEGPSKHGWSPSFEMVPSTDDLWKNAFPQSSEPVDDASVWRMAHVMIKTYGDEEPIRLAQQRAEIARDRGEGPDFMLWTRVADAVRQLSGRPGVSEEVH